MMGADNHAGKAQADFFDQKSKAYLFGVYLGDGCCSKSRDSGYNFSLTSADKDVVENVMHIVNKILQKNRQLKIKMPNKTELYFFRAYDKQLFQMLTSETESKSKLPKFVMDSEQIIKIEFIAGLMDTDGYISTGKNKFGYQRFSLGFINSGKWINEFILLLETLGVKVGKKTLKKKYRSINEKDCYQININLRSFVEAKMYFNCQRKQRLLEIYKSSVRYQSY